MVGIGKEKILMAILNKIITFNLDMIKFKILSKNSKFPDHGLFGFKIINYWQSILFAYIFIFFQFLIVPFFGYDPSQLISGALFIFLINLSIIILICNSLIKIKSVNFNTLIINTPLYIFIPFSLHKIFIQLNYLISLYT